MTGDVHADADLTPAAILVLVASLLVLSTLLAAVLVGWWP